MEHNYIISTAYYISFSKSKSFFFFSSATHRTQKKHQVHKLELMPEEMAHSAGLEEN